MSFIEVVMIIVIVTGAEKPNITHQIHMPDMDTCFEEAKEFTHHGLPKEWDGHGVKIMCGGEFAKASDS